MRRTFRPKERLGRLLVGLVQHRHRMVVDVHDGRLDHLGLHRCSCGMVVGVAIGLGGEDLAHGGDFAKADAELVVRVRSCGR